MKKTKRPSPSKFNYYVVTDSGVIFVGKIGSRFCTLSGNDKVNSWSDWKSLILQSQYVFNGIGESIPVDEFIRFVQEIPVDRRSKMFDSFAKERPQWIFSGEVRQDLGGYTINYRDFI